MSGNTYLDQVVGQQERLEADLRSKRSVAAPAAPAPAAGGSRRRGGAGGAGRASPAPNAVDVRVTGFGRWKTVLVPPNAFVVHTRRGHDEPLHVGLGVVVPVQPGTDSFLVVPGAMQTILINAYCICRELQGVLVQAYVQWIIQDFATAYRKLDFGDVEDPMRLVNLQLKEQAEAAIKDKVATMGVDEVLSDKQPIIEELTARLRGRRRGRRAAPTRGLGLRIVTVQIKEAVVSSPRLWENLQKPFRVRAGPHRPPGRAGRRGGDRRPRAGRAAADARRSRSGQRPGARRPAGAQRGARVRPRGGREAAPRRARAGGRPRARRAAGRDDPARAGPGTAARRRGGRDGPAAHRAGDAS